MNEWITIIRRLYKYDMVAGHYILRFASERSRSKWRL